MDSAQKIELVPASLADYPIIQNMGRFYVYDISEYMGGEDWIIPANGLFECIDFKKYWETQEAYPFIIRVNNETAGFAIVDTKGSDPAVDFNMAQFFILRRFKGKGIGRQVACACFERFKGVWEVMVLLENKGAYQFWKKVIASYAKGHFEEYTKMVKVLKNLERNIFRFQTN